MPPVSEYIKATLKSLGIPYSLSDSQVLIKKGGINRDFTKKIAAQYPQYTFYWETPRMLKWF